MEEPDTQVDHINGWRECSDDQSTHGAAASDQSQSARRIAVTQHPGHKC